ncbi:MAG: DUF3843 family protein [Bacteroidales bacterium]|nr:DUF3843 family protein [Bacteroidales bacterium]
MKKLYPFDWQFFHPKRMSTSTDRYYVDIANKILNILSNSDIREAFYDDGDMRYSSLRITAWFEDICSELGFWRVVNETCMKRYGKPLPFYDTTDYVAGEPNLQDVKLLLWDIIQSLDGERFFNPENPAIASAAIKIFEIFDAEYETAPETDEVKEYFDNPDLGTEYWTTRRAVEWLSNHAYFSLRSNLTFIGTVARIEDEISEAPDYKRLRNIYIYTADLLHTFKDRHNLISLTAPEWLSAAIGRDFSFDTALMDNIRAYDIDAHVSSSLVLRDRLTGVAFAVDDDSFDPKWLKKNGDKFGTSVCCGLLRFNGNYYQCGSMLTNPSPEDIENQLEQTRQDEYRRRMAKENYDEFYRVSGGKPIIFLKGEKALLEFYTKRLGIKITEDFENQLKTVAREHAENGLLAIMATPDQGFLTISYVIPSIKSPDNPYYDAEYAKKHAHELLLNVNAIDYEAICTMLKLNYLPDAALNSLKGYEYGRDFLHANAQYIVDYMFAEHQ